MSFRCALGKLVALALIALLEPARGQDSSGAVLFPERPLVRSMVADGTAHRLSVARSLESRHVWTSIGGTIPVLGVFLFGLPAQIGMGASVHTSLDPGQSISVISAEYYVDFLLIDIAWPSGFSSRAGLGHTSHHLGDNEVLLQRGTSLDYSRDYAHVLILAALPTGKGRVYAGGNYSYGFVVGRRIDKPWLFQLGAEYWHGLLERGLAVIGACDVKFHQESGFGSTQRYLVGLQYVTAGGRRIRVEFSHLRGLDERGQFTGQRGRWNSVGAVFEF